MHRALNRNAHLAGNPQGAQMPPGPVLIFRHCKRFARMDGRDQWPATDRPRDRGVKMADRGAFTAWRIAPVLAVLLAGCVARGEIQDHVGRINESVGTSRNEAILLNIVRASRDEPLYFTTLPSVSGEGRTQLSTGLPDVTFGGGQGKYVLSNSVNNQTVSSFDVGVLESKNFYDGLLSPINLAEANLIIHQGYSRALVFSLLVDRIRVTSGNTVEEIRNQPANADEFRRFQEYLYLAVHYGLTVGYQQGANGKQEAQLCFDQALAGPEQKPFVRRSPIQCTTQPANGKKRGRPSDLLFVIDGKPQTIEIISRSPNQIFRYLGSMIDAASAGQPVTLYGDQPGTTQGPLLVITKDPVASCFSRLKYGGEVYCVPNANAENTKRIFQILNQILALNTSPDDIPPTRTLVITQ